MYHFFPFLSLFGIFSAHQSYNERWPWPRDDVPPVCLTAETAVFSYKLKAMRNR